ncbi:MAG: MFS transporter [Candidatus Dormibacteraeota bacterium]|nr:MFS transporter [Candidatus Dormibacteraeota bacterium]
MAEAWIYVLILVALCGLSGWVAIRFLAQGTVKTISIGVLSLLASLILPLFFGRYGWPIGTLSAVMGAIVATVQFFMQRRWKAGLSLVGAVALIATGSPFLVFVSYLQEAEQVDRCQADVAVKAIELTPWAGGRFPADIHDVAMAVDRFQSPSCTAFVPNHYLYRAGSTDYTFGYWNDWIIGKHVCLHSAGQHGWSCGLNRWGPFPAAT